MSKTFLRWVGGKHNLVKELLVHLPSDIHSRKYIEPFLGGGSLFFSVLPKLAFLSDLNGRLINCYAQIKNHPNEVSLELSNILNNHSKENYYKIRSEFNNGASNIKRAAELIYLNKTSFNGIYRVNQNGDYNVPFGFIEKPSIVDQKEINDISVNLRSAEIEVAPFESSIKYASDNTFYYLDPPYPPLNETSFFTHYTPEKFNYSDHERVHDFATKLSEQNVKVLISNADVKFIRELFRDWNIIRTSTVRWVSCKNKKFKVNELIIKNY